MVSAALMVSEVTTGTCFSPRNAAKTLSQGLPRRSQAAPPQAMHVPPATLRPKGCRHPQPTVPQPAGRTLPAQAAPPPRGGESGPAPTLPPLPARCLPAGEASPGRAHAVPIATPLRGGRRTRRRRRARRGRPAPGRVCCKGPPCRRPPPRRLPLRPVRLVRPRSFFPLRVPEGWGRPRLPPTHRCGGRGRFSAAPQRHVSRVGREGKGPRAGAQRAGVGRGPRSLGAGSHGLFCPTSPARDAGLRRHPRETPKLLGIRPGGVASACSAARLGLAASPRPRQLLPRRAAWGGGCSCVTQILGKPELRLSPLGSVVAVAGAEPPCGAWPRCLCSCSSPQGGGRQCPLCWQALTFVFLLD